MSSTKESYGIIYIWYDRKHKRYYIGSHWGKNPENDNYICSSTWMRNSYHRRPDDFKRRIISRIYTSRWDLLKLENSILQRREHKRDRYYNLMFFAGVTYFEKHTEETKSKISKSSKGKPAWSKGKIFSEEEKLEIYGSRIGRKHTEETKSKMSVSAKGKSKPPRTDEHKVNMSLAKKGKKRRPPSEETKAKISASLKGKPGTPCTEEQKAKISASLKGKPKPPRTKEHNEKLAASKQNVSEETKKKMSESAKNRKGNFNACI